MPASPPEDAGPWPGAGGPDFYSHFDLCGPLPRPGVTVLEASAGTGKTYTVAALLTRMVAEGVATLADILVVTFTRMATGELRERARQSLADTEAGLRSLLAQHARLPEPAGGNSLQPTPGAGALVGLLGQGPLEVVASRRQRLADALAAFDAATITTTHGFCHMVLEALGVAGEVAEGAELLEDPGDLVSEVVDDLYVRHAVLAGNAPFNRSTAAATGAQAVANPGAPLEPAADRSDGTAPGLRRRLAAAVRSEVDRRLFEANLLTYDGLLVRLAETLGRQGRGPAACAKLRQRYRVVLIDEFQDTDLVQWEVVRLAFADGATTLVLIGDPKQAVYAFRGADIYAYLAAARAAGPGDRFTLECNWRSDLDLLKAFNTLFTPLQLGHPEIRYRTAQATVGHRRPGLQGAPHGAPLRARVLDRRASWAPLTSKGLAQKQGAVRLIAEDLADDIVNLLEAGAEIVTWDAEGGPEGKSRPVTPGDVGVLVRTNRQAGVVHDALRAAGVPAVVAGADSVLTTGAARQWLTLLEALEQPAARAPAVAVALGPFGGMSAGEVATAGEETWERLHERLHRWAGVARQDGMASLYADIAAGQALPSRLLAQRDGERLLTDLGHVAELLHAQSNREQLGLPALRAWLARRTEETVADGTEAAQRSRRLDSGSDAVQLLTVHRAKGLEFPVVYCPYLWDGARPERLGNPVVFHDPEDAYRRKLDVGGDDDDPGYRRHYASNQAEQRGEDLRHLYVALTRARHQVVLWWAGAQDCQHSALGRLLLRRDASGAVAPRGQVPVPSDEQLRAALGDVAAAAGGLVSVEACGPGRGRRWAGSVPGPGPSVLQAAPFERALDYGWRRSSFTSLTAAAHPASQAQAVGSEPEEPGTSDEPAPAGAPGTLLAPLSDGQRPEGLGVAPGTGGPAGPEPPSPWSAVPAGAEMGTFVHRVLERADFAALDLRRSVQDAVTAEGLGYPGAPETLTSLVDGLATAVAAPLGPLAAGASLAGLGRGDRLDELTFEMPVAGGDSPRTALALADVARLWRRHVPAPALLAAYADRLADPALVPRARGYLTGSLDLVFRASVGGRPRYLVADYKTNWLAPPGQALTAWHYRPEALEAEMLRAHYPLQAAFYVVALHRYLRWRLAGYRPEEHLGGVLYLFLRGMTAPVTPAAQGMPTGVFSWSPPTGLVTGLSALISGQP